MYSKFSSLKSFLKDPIAFWNTCPFCLKAFKQRFFISEQYGAVDENLKMSHSGENNVDLFHNHEENSHKSYRTTNKSKKSPLRLGKRVSFNWKLEKIQIFRNNSRSFSGTFFSKNSSMSRILPNNLYTNKTLSGY